MKTAIMQPYFFPYIGYFQLINVVDKFVIYDDVHFFKKGYINRNNILYNNKPYQFTLHLKGASQNKLIHEIEVGTNTAKLLKTFNQSYKKAPNFDRVFPLVEEALLQQEQNLAKFLGYILEILLKYMQINTELLYSSEIEKNNSLKGQDKIIEICQRLNARHYVNAIGGMQLYDKREFSRNNIILNFLETDNIEYPQFSNKFVSKLSIIDVLMFNDVETVHKFLQKYRLI